MPRKPLVPPGSRCVSDRAGIEHLVQGPDDDADLQKVYGWLRERPLEVLLTGAVVDAVEYVLDGARTWRFDLDSPEVDSDERASVGTKLQYRVLAALGLIKEPPLDTKICGVAVELKGTVRTSWMIPREGQCEICMLIQVDPARDRHRALLMRTHRVWLNDGGNQDQKRTITAAARETYALELLPWTPMPANPLKLLTPQQAAVVFELRQGIKRRLTAMFGFLPEVVIPRVAIETVGATRKDALRRARQAKPAVYAEHGLVVLMGTWTPQRELAARHGFDISGAAWIAVRPETLGEDFEEARAMALSTPAD